MRKFLLMSLVLLIGVMTYNNQLSAQNISDSVAKRIIAKFPNRLGLASVEGNKEFAISSAYYDIQTGNQYIYIQQTHHNIRVFNVIKSVVLKNDILLHASGNFIENINKKATSAVHTITAGDAIIKAATHLGLATPSNLSTVSNTFSVDNKIVFNNGGIAKKNIETELVWVSNDDGKSVHLAWNINIDVLHSSNWWNVRVDAITGAIINKDNWTVSCKMEKSGTRRPAFNNNNIATSMNKALNENKNSKNFNFNLFTPPSPPLGSVASAGYNVIPFPYESPLRHAPSVETDPWNKAGANNFATSYGWHYDGTTSYNITRGNNVFAYDDSLNQNAPGRSTTSTTGFPTLSFLDQPNFSQQPYTTANRQFNTTNLFYWNNLMHDVTYQYGFTEVAGNFQADNIGRGGAGGDYVRAEAQDGSGTDNANFSTPADGGSGRMQMYLWNGGSGLTVNTPSSIAGKYASQEGKVSTANLLVNVGPVTAPVVLFNDDNTGTNHRACNGNSATSVAGKIALVYRGGCTFVIKIKNAQLAGAKAVIMVDTVIGGNLVTMSGADNTITIPAVFVTNDDGGVIAAEVAAGNNVTATLTAPTLLDGDADNAVMCHEFTHGISNRLTGGPANASCLNNAEEGGEGWSDYVSLMMTQNWATTTLADSFVKRPVGIYVWPNDTTNGIRTYPYCYDMIVDPHTYADVADPTNNGEVHYIGEIWCSALWDMTWEIIKQVGAINPNLYDAKNSNANGGNTIALKLVMEGMRIQTCSPGFLDARDAILAADSILYGNAHKCAIWRAFARRGMGWDAVQGSSNSTTDQVDGYALPPSVTFDKSVTALATNPGKQITITLKSTCQCASPQNNFTIVDTIPVGFSYVSSTGGTVNGNIVSFPAFNFNNDLESKTFTITLSATGAGCTIDTAINDDRDANQKGGFVAKAITGTPKFTASTTRYYSPSNSWYAANGATATNTGLTSGSITANQLSVVSFWHYYTTEDLLDGGVFEISPNNGTTWVDAAPYFIKNGYNQNTLTSSPFKGKGAFNGVSYDKFVQTMINLSSFAGKTIKVRFRMQTNGSNVNGSTYYGWFIDDILETNGCGAINKSYLFDGNNEIADAVSTPIYITTTPLPLELLDFQAHQIETNVLLQWKTTAEVNTLENVIEKSIDGANWFTLGRKATTNTSGEHTYSLYDNSPSFGTNFYRIKMVDRDGKYRYSMIRTINVSRGKTAPFVIAPNPANAFVNLYFNKDIQAGTIKVLDAQGRTVISKAISELVNGSVQLNTQNLSNGIYLINFNTYTGNNYSQRLIISK